MQRKGGDVSKRILRRDVIHFHVEVDCDAAEESRLTEVGAARTWRERSERTFVYVF